MDYPRQLKEKLTEVIKKENEPAAILFSGGIDSTAIALIFKELNKRFHCYTVGIKNSKDIEYAKKVAEALGFPLTTRVFSKKEIMDAIEKVKEILGYDDPIDVPVGTVTYLATKIAKEKVVYSGLGSDEFLAGYQGHRIHGIQEEIKYRLNRVKVDIARDEKIAKANRKEVKLPFMEIKEFLISIPDELKIKEDTNKFVLRKMLKEMEVPEWIYSRKKTAAQYGSGFSKIYKDLKHKR